MRIGISAVFHFAGGSRTHLVNLLRAWHADGIDVDHSITLFARRENLDQLNASDLQYLRTCEVGGREFSREKKLLWEQVAFPDMVWRAGLDVLFCPGSLVPLRCKVPRVVMMRNAAPFSPEVTLKRVGLDDWLTCKILGRAMALSGQAAERIIFISHHFKELFLARYPRLRSKCHVVYHGRDSLSSASVDSPPPGAYILSHAHLHRYKNFPALIEGYGLAKDALQKHGLRLVLAGGNARKSHLRLLQRIIREHGLEKWVELLGPVEPSRSAALLHSCEFFVFQSTCENCPNALLEALSLGLPIASSNASVMPEFAGDAVEYFDPFNPRDIAEALTRLAGDSALRAALRQRALLRAARLPTWTDVGRQTLQVLESAVSTRECYSTN